NGAGKTTLVKLLAGLYEPEAGEITVDGVTLDELDLQSWRRQLAVIFQDFVRYELSAADNVGFGGPSVARDRRDTRSRRRARRRRGCRVEPPRRLGHAAGTPVHRRG
ncbi:MAG: ATP-binding cassette domain-containing protein, partial [Acidimicrobiales bacterium]|nr:ATP-binding cassette domain-containing protein [Acidimicrobiales bacterium]